MKWLRMAMYALPPLVVGVWVIGQLGLSALGAECRGDLLDGGLRCNKLGRAQQELFYEGMPVVLVSIAIWAGWIVGVGVGAIWDWFSKRQSAPHRL